jgi:hypothetical protein
MRLLRHSVECLGEDKANVAISWGGNRCDNGGKSNREYVHAISFVRGGPVSDTRWTPAERILIGIGSI